MSITVVCSTKSSLFAALLAIFIAIVHSCNSVDEDVYTALKACINNFTPGTKQFFCGVKGAGLKSNEARRARSNLLACILRSAKTSLEPECFNTLATVSTDKFTFMLNNALKKIETDSDGPCTVSSN